MCVRRSRRRALENRVREAGAAERSGEVLATDLLMPRAAGRSCIDLSAAEVKTRVASTWVEMKMKNEVMDKTP